MTIEELARVSGVTTRTIRAHQSAGLVPPPSLDGRVGRYGDDHLSRLRAIRALQRRGYSLAAIRDLMTAWERGRSLGDVLGLEPTPGVESAGTEWFEELFAGYPETMSGWAALAQPSRN